MTDLPYQTDFNFDICIQSQIERKYLNGKYFEKENNASTEMSKNDVFSDKKRNYEKNETNLLGKMVNGIRNSSEISEYPFDNFLSMLRIKKITDKEVFIWKQIKDCSVIIPKMPDKVAELIRIRDQNKGLMEADHHIQNKIENKSIVENLKDNNLKRSIHKP